MHSADTPKAPPGQGRAIILIAKSAIAVAPREEMARLVHITAGRAGGAWVAYAFTEQGEPSLREVVLGLLGEPIAEILFVPLLLPLEPSFSAWLTKTLQRWRQEYLGPWPTLRIGGGLSASALMPDLLAELVDHSAKTAPVAMPGKLIPAGSLVPAQRRRVLVCQGGPCMAAGASLVWGHLRNEQARLNLRESGEGVMSAKTSCLGPCNLAPVMQVWPEGITYGGLDEVGVDRIIAGHLLGGRVVEALAYRPGDGKRRLRQPDQTAADGQHALSTDCDRASPSDGAHP